MATLVSAPLPDLTLSADALLTVDTQDANALVTALTIHLAQDVPEAVLAEIQSGTLLGYVPMDGG